MIIGGILVRLVLLQGHAQLITIYTCSDILVQESQSFVRRQELPPRFRPGSCDICAPWLQTADRENYRNEHMALLNYCKDIPTASCRVIIYGAAYTLSEWIYTAVY